MKNPNLAIFWKIHLKYNLNDFQKKVKIRTISVKLRKFEYFSEIFQQSDLMSKDDKALFFGIKGMKKSENSVFFIPFG